MGGFRDIVRPAGDRLTDCVGLGVLVRVVPHDLVDEVLNLTGKSGKRSRLLPARMVVYYVLALTLFYADSYEEVMRKMVNGLRFLRSWRRGWEVPTSGGISKARVRLGAGPLEELFFRVAVPIATSRSPGSWYQDRRVMALDGVVLDAPDTPDNVAVFGKKPVRDGLEGAYPQVRVVGLTECGTHAMVAAVIDSWRVYERELAQRLCDRVEPNMLVLADRGFYSYDLWRCFADTGAALVWRVAANIELPVLTPLPDGSYLSRLLPARVKRDIKRGKQRNPPPGALISVRVVEYRIANRPSPEVIRLATTLVDHTEYPAAQLAGLYSERWEIELGLDEMETHQMGTSSLLRSKKPELVRQEIWALLITHYAIRHLMHEAADTIDIDEDRLSFTRSLRVVQRAVINDAGFPPSPDTPHLA